jgi:hypothetical protein
MAAFTGPGEPVVRAISTAVAIITTVGTVVTAYARSSSRM